MIVDAALPHDSVAMKASRVLSPRFRQAKSDWNLGERSVSNRYPQHSATPRNQRQSSTIDKQAANASQ